MMRAAITSRASCAVLLAAPFSTTTTTVAQPPIHLRNDLFTLARIRDPIVLKNPLVIQDRVKKATRLIDQVSHHPAQHLSGMKTADLVTCMDSVVFCNFTIQVNYTPLVDAMLEELMSRLDIPTQQAFFRHSTDAGKLARTLCRFASPSVLARLDAKVAQEFAFSKEQGGELTYAQFEFMLRLGEHSKRVLFAAPGERHLVHLINVHSDRLLGSTMSFLGSVAVEAMLWSRTSGGENTNLALQQLLGLTLDKLVTVADNVTATKWAFQLFEANHRRSRQQLDYEWSAEPFKLRLGDALLSNTRFAFRISPKVGDFDLGTMALGMWTRPKFWAQFGHGIGSFASEVAQQVAQRLEQDPKRHQFPSVPYHLNHIPPNLFLDSKEDRAVLARIGNLLADRVLALTLTEVAQLTPVNLERMLWDMERTTKMDQVFTQVVLPYFAQQIWEERPLRMLLKFPRTPIELLVDLLETSPIEGIVLPDKLFELFTYRLSPQQRTRLSPKLDELFLRSSESGNLTVSDLFKLVTLFAGNPECLQRLWKQAETFSNNGLLALDLDQFGKLNSQGKLEMVLSLSQSNNHASSDPTMTTSFPTTAVIRNPLLQPESELVRSTDLAISHLIQDSASAPRAMANAICTRLEKHLDGDMETFVPQLQTVLGAFDLSFLCRIAGSSPTRELREACLERVETLLKTTATAPTALDVFFGFNNLMPRFLERPPADALPREQWVVNELAGQMLDLNFASLSVKLLINSLKTLQRIDESFPELKIEFRDALLARLAQTVSERAVEVAKPEDLVRASNILAHFQLPSQASAISSSLLAGPAGRQLATYLDLTNADEFITTQYELKNYSEMDLALTSLSPTEAIKSWISARAMQLELNVVEQMRIAEWLALNSPSSSPRSQLELDFFQQFAIKVKQSQGRVEEPKLNPVDLLLTFAEMDVIDTEVFAGALKDIAGDLEFYLAQSSAEEFAELEQVLQVARKTNPHELVPIDLYLQDHPRSLL
ncbi:hypothetical protein BASA81_012123 [Batrachochytrium salamandrivorans]|nr:hypothetical protein BASA81_012123 [Batrachochytrium salamandrivorans]